jgi:hypothetical protein
VGEEDVEVVDAVFDQRQPGGTETGTGVEDQRVRATAHLDARGVAAVAQELAAGHRNAAAHTPEPHPELVIGHADPWPRPYVSTLLTC